MLKSEFKKRVKDIMQSTKIAIEKTNECLSEYSKIVECLNSIQEIEKKNDIEIGIDYNDIKVTAIRCLIDENECFQECINKLENLIVDTETWMDNVNITKAELIQEEYISVLEEIQGDLDIEDIEDEEDLKNRLNDAVNRFNDLLN